MSTEHWRPRLLGRLAAIIAAATMAVGAVATPAQADNFGGCYGPLVDQGCVPDDFAHTWCYDESAGAINDNYRAHIINAVAWLAAHTSYNAVLDPTAACDDTTDVRWQVTTAVAPNRGDYFCLSATGGRCDRARLRLNPNLLTDNDNRRKTACHELGHSVGLAHGSSGATPEFFDDCMVLGPVDANARWRILNAHHIEHANNRA